MKALGTLLVLSLLLSAVVLACGSLPLSPEQRQQVASLAAQRDAALEMGDEAGAAAFQAEMDQIYAQAAQDATKGGWWELLLGFLPGPWKEIGAGLATLFAPILFDQSRQRAKDGFKRVAKATGKFVPWNAKVDFKQGVDELLAAGGSFLDMWRGEWGQLSLRKPVA